MNWIRTCADRLKAFAGYATLGSGLGIEQSPFLSRIFDPNTTLPQFFNTLFKSALIVGAILAVLRLAYAGALYMTTDLVGSKTTARAIIGETLLGLLLLISVYLILNQINPQILNLDITQGVKPGAAGQQ